MPPIGWRQRSVPSSAPTSEIRLLKMGIPHAITYAVMFVKNVQPSQVSQCLGVLEIRWGVSRRRQMKSHFAGI
jgi:hypothetical protein